MSKIDELIKEKCPNGVEFKQLGDVCKFVRGKGMSKSDKNDGDTNIILYGELYTTYGNYITDIVSHADFDKAKNSTLLQKNDIVIPISSTTKEAQIGKASAICVDEPVYLGGDALCLRHEQVPGFLVHLLNSAWFEQRKMKYVRGTTIMHLSPDGIKKIKIPVPPIEVQREIVGMLNSFTELEAELETELEARKRQYEYYRDYLLSFENIASEGGQVEWLALDKLCSISAGGDVPKDALSDVKTNKYPIPIISNGIGNNAVYGYTTNAKIIKPAVTISARGTIGYAEYRDYPYYPIVRLLSVIPNDSEELNTKYLYYCLQCKKYKLPTSGIPQLTAPDLKKQKVPVPPKKIQERIVYALDNFDTVCNDLNIGLPAEIEARQKQYEYYRDRLLSFDAVIGDGTERERERGVAKLRQYTFGYASVRLNDVILSLNTGLNPRSFFRLNTDDATNYYITIREIHDGNIIPTDKTDRINDEALRLCNNRSNLEAGDVLFSGTGTIGETAVITATPKDWNIKEGVYTIKPDQEFIIPMFLRYALMSKDIVKEYEKKIVGGTVKSIPMKELKNISICIPTLEKQQEIIDLVDRFNTLCNDIKSGLPAEIEARHKQYEYYRDKLLTFQKNSAI